MDYSAHTAVILVLADGRTGERVGHGFRIEHDEIPPIPGEPHDRLGFIRGEEAGSRSQPFWIPALPTGAHVQSFSRKLLSLLLLAEEASEVGEVDKPRELASDETVDCLAGLRTGLLGADERAMRAAGYSSDAATGWAKGRERKAGGVAREGGGIGTGWSKGAGGEQMGIRRLSCAAWLAGSPGSSPFVEQLHRSVQFMHRL